MHRAVDETIGALSGASPGTRTTTITVDGRRLTNLVMFVPGPIYLDRSFLIWDLTITGMRPGPYPMRLEFATADGTFTYPSKGLNPQEMAVMVPGP